MFRESAYLFAIINYFSSDISVNSFCNATFFHSGYVIKPRQPSSTVYGAPSFAGHPGYMPTTGKLLKKRLTNKYVA